MIWTLDAVLRSSVVLAAGLLLAAALRRRRAALRHALLAGAIFGSALVPAAGRMLPTVAIAVPQANAAVPSAATPGALRVAAADVGRQIGTARPVPQFSRARLVWLSGGLLLSVLLAIDLFRVRRLIAAATPIDDPRWLDAATDIRRAFGIRAPIPLLATRRSDVLATSGFLRPCVLLPSNAASWPDERIRVVLSHELAHIRRSDWAVQLCAESVRILCWFNPLAWMACARLRRESEHACDDVVVAAGVRPADYAAHLLEIARICRKPPRVSSAMTMARPTTLHRRIAVMLNAGIDHRAAAPRRLAWMAGLLFCAAVSAVAIQAKQAGPAPLTGTLYDSTGAVLPGVAVTLRDANDATQSATSDRAGRYEFPLVAPGRYRLAISLPGFHTLDAEFDLKQQPDWDRPITLQIGTLQETIHVSASRVGAPPPAAGAGAQPVRIGGNIRAPRKLVDVKPLYPPEMRAAGREGVVPIEATIRVDGTVGSVRVLSAEVHPDFAIAAVDAVRQWRFSPTLLNGKPVEVVMNVSITFKLSD